MAEVYQTGDTVNFSFITTDTLGALANADSASLDLLKPDYSHETLTLVNPTTGVYVAEWVAGALQGEYYATFTATGANGGTTVEAFAVGSLTPDGYTTTDSFGSLIDEVIMSLLGFGISYDQVGTLDTDLAVDGFSFSVTGTELVRGVVEIDKELIWVQSVDSGLATVPPWGRGFKGTGPAPHDAGAAVYVSPQFPRSIVAREVNNTIRSLYPQLFAVHTVEITGDGYTRQWEMPSPCDRVVNVEWQYGDEPWCQVGGWELVHSANTATFSTGMAIHLPQAPSGTKYHVTYAAAPGLFGGEAELFGSTGLPTTCRDVVVLGAASRLMPWLDAGRIPTPTVQADLVDQTNAIGTAVAVGKELRQRYERRLAEERNALLLKYPLRPHRVRG